MASPTGDERLKFQSPITISRCSECVSSQVVSSHRNVRRARRSNSCPGTIAGCYSSTVSPLHRVITKRWHSLPAIPLTITDHTNIQPMPIRNGVALSWLPLHTSCQISKSLSLSKRITSLFAIGVLFAFLLNFLQKQNKVTVFPPGIFGDVLNSAWWIPPTFGLAATAVGLMYPKLDQLLGNQRKLNPEWSSVMRCIAVFVGINHASAKISFDSNVHLSITLAMLSFGLWYFFDRSLCGFGLGLAITLIATAVTQLLVAMDVFGYSNPDFLYMQSWIPCLFFSGGVTIGAIGRALATFDGTTKSHMD